MNLTLGTKVRATGKGLNSGRQFRDAVGIVKDCPTQKSRKEFFVQISPYNSDEMWEWFSEEDLDPI